MIWERQTELLENKVGSLIQKPNLVSKYIEMNMIAQNSPVLDDAGVLNLKAFCPDFFQLTICGPYESNS